MCLPGDTGSLLAKALLAKLRDYFARWWPLAFSTACFFLALHFGGLL